MLIWIATVWVLGAAFVVRWLAVATRPGPKQAPLDPREEDADLVQAVVQDVYGPLEPEDQAPGGSAPRRRPGDARGDPQELARPRLPR